MESSPQSLNKELIDIPIIDLPYYSKKDIEYLEKNPHMINEDNKAQFIILRNKLLGEDMTPYRLIAKISENFLLFNNTSEIINDRPHIITEQRREHYELHKSKKKDMINLLTKWKKYKEHILQYHEIISKNVSLRDDLLESLNQYPF